MGIVYAFGRYIVLVIGILYVFAIIIVMIVEVAGVLGYGLVTGILYVLIMELFVTGILILFWKR